MAVMDFREGGIGFTLSRQRARRNRDFEEKGWDALDAAAPEASAAAGSRRFAANPEGDGLAARLARLTHYLGALVSVGLMVGLLVWGWQLVMRDVSGVPVIKALVGEARTAPEEPGGELTSYTGYAVNDVAEGAEIAPASEVAIAPQPTGLDASDVAMGDLGATAQPALPAETPVAFDEAQTLAMTDAETRAAAEAARAEAEAARAAMQMAAADASVAAADVVDAPASEGPVNAAVLDESGQPVQPDAINAALAQAQGGLAASPRPVPRPRRAAVPAAAPVQVAAAEPAAAAPAPAARPAAREVAAEAAPAAAPAPQQAAPAAGAPLVQIGAFDSDAIAASEWGRVSGKFGDLFAGKGQVIQKHSANGRTFWRLRVAGFQTRAEAQEFCAALKAAGTDCIPATSQ